MKVKMVVTCLLMLSSLSGCMSSAEREQKLIESKQKLIENPEKMCKFTVNKNYQEVYRIVKENLKECEGVGPAGQTKLNAELHTDIKQGVITIQFLGAFDARALYHYEIKALSAVTSEYTSYSQFKGEPDCAEFKRFIEEYEG